MRKHKISEFGPPAHFYECPRWHAGRWWASDMRGRTVYSLSPDGEARVELSLDDARPGGLGWSPEGDMLVVSMERKALLRRDRAGGAFRPWVDLSALVAGTTGFLNDMAVSRSGHVYAGFDADPTSLTATTLA